jgi:beta-xylosidase
MPLCMLTQKSKDLVSWSYIGDALDFSMLVGSQDFWAPEVVYRNGKFYLYVSIFLFAITSSIQWRKRVLIGAYQSILGILT